MKVIPVSMIQPKTKTMKRVILKKPSKTIRTKKSNRSKQSENYDISDVNGEITVKSLTTESIRSEDD